MASISNENIQLDGLFAGLSAIIGKTIIAPVERIKIILQTQHTILSMKQNNKNQYKGFIDCFKSIIRDEGVLSLWRGNMLNVIRYAPTQAVNFSLNSFFQKQLINKNIAIENNSYKYFLAGGLAGMVSICIFYPFDFFKTRITTDMGKSKKDRELGSILNCAKKIYTNEGIKGFYRGLSISVFVVFMYRGIYFGGSAYGKLNFPILSENKIIKFIYFHMLSISAGVFLHPLDTIRRRLMLQQGRNIQDRDYSTFMQACIKIYSQEGVKGYFKGALVNSFRSLSSTIVMFLFDEITNYRKEINK